MSEVEALLLQLLCDGKGQDRRARNNSGFGADFEVGVFQHGGQHPASGNGLIREGLEVKLRVPANGLRDIVNENPQILFGNIILEQMIFGILENFLFRNIKNGRCWRRRVPQIPTIRLISFCES